MPFRFSALPTLVLVGLLATPALAQDKTVTGQNTIVPGTGPGTSPDGTGGGGLMWAPSAEDAARRQGLKPVTFLASKMIGVEVRNPAGDSVGKIEDLLIGDGNVLKAVVIDVGGFLGVGSRQIAVEPSALVLRPGGDRFAAVLNMGKDTIAAAATFKPDQVLKTP
ncbi:PRC-barrel domain-containing protein [Methylobacterium sp. NEAU 140]|uniref:PRC-barrel domain-containing protein n=1 Tax=Methylobacterium sp. NEAU 140 TaxID=3064945 RepID=UPI0027349A3D|nr:PRC-barrel domain-containing protein [Methylobacterium sp. NEAU 140]MDP4024182.1 PRC-barrel domain-containing protein [Methylobacterium sp. NEAU 140]